MKILVVDDNPARHSLFSQIYFGEEVTSVFSYWEAVDAMAKTQFDVVQLDHDLGDFRKPDVSIDGMYSKTELNGYHVAHYMVTDLDKSMRPNVVIVQSANEVGAQNIKDLLTKNGIETILRPVSNSAKFDSINMY
jgi:CheY-like chemotaxis protein